MGWSGGTFTRVHNFSADASAGIQAQASRFDAEFDEYKTGLENCVTLDGQNTASGDLPMGGNKHTGVGAATSAQEYLRADQNTQQTGIYIVGTVSNHTFSASAAVFPGQLSEGMRVCVRSSSGILTGGSVTASAVQIIVNGLSANVVNINGKYPAGQTLIPVNNPREFVYSSANGGWQALNDIQASASSNVRVMVYNGSAGSYQTTTTAGFNFKRSGNLVSWNRSGVLNISASVSVAHFAIPVDDIPIWARQAIYGDVSPDSYLGTVIVYNSSADAFTHCSLYDPNASYIEITPHNSTLKNGLNVIHPFSVTMPARG